MVTIKQVSELADVSVATVSRVVNGNRWVAENTRRRVRDAMEQLGYQPNTVARALVTNRTETVGMIVANLSGPFYGDLMYQVEHSVRAHGKHLVVTSSHGQLEGELDAIEFLLKRKVDALILQLDSMSDTDILSLKARVSIPLVIVNRYVPELSDYCIYVNNEKGAQQVTDLLLTQSHRCIACITGPLFKQDSRDRLQGYRQALANTGISFQPDLVVESDFTEAGGADALKRLLKRTRDFTAIVCGNDLMALGVISYAKKNGIKVPENLSVVGFDDIVVSSYIDPSLTTMRVPIGEMGEQAGSLACTMTEKIQTPVKLQFTPTLIQRNSTQSI